MTPRQALGLRAVALELGATRDLGLAVREARQGCPRAIVGFAIGGGVALAEGIDGRECLACSGVLVAACGEIAAQAIEAAALGFERGALVVECGDGGCGVVDAECRALGEPPRVLEPARKLAVLVGASDELVEARLEIGDRKSVV